MALVQNTRASSEEWMLLEQEIFAGTVKPSGIFMTYISPKLLLGKRRFQEPFFPQTHQNCNLESTEARSLTLFWNKCHYSHVMKDENSAQKGWGARAPSAKGRELHLVLQDAKHRAGRKECHETAWRTLRMPDHQEWVWRPSVVWWGYLSQEACWICSSKRGYCSLFLILTMGL